MLQPLGRVTLLVLLTVCFAGLGCMKKHVFPNAGIPRDDHPATAQPPDEPPPSNEREEATAYSIEPHVPQSPPDAEGTLWGKPGEGETGAPPPPHSKPKPANLPRGATAGESASGSSSSAVGGAVDRFLEEMSWGSVAFNTPRSMELGTTIDLQLLLSQKESVESLRRSITAAGETEGATVRISEIMEADLSGPGFEITPITAKEQGVSSQERTEWKWSVKATASGPQVLHLTLTAVLRLEGQSTKRSIRTLDKSIDVTVTWPHMARDFMGKNWQWLWAAILVPIAGWVWRKKRTASGT